MPDNYPQWEVKQVADQYGLMVQNSAAASKSQHTVYSPLILAGSASVLSFDYYNNATTFADSLVVTIVSEGVESAPILVAKAASSNGSWTQFSYDLSEYDGRVIRVKFYICTSQSMNDTYVGIDNISVSCHVNGDVYVFAGNTYSQAGTYVGNFYTDLGCDSIVTLTLIVTTDVDNSYVLPLVVAPNPVLGGQSTFVNREWTMEEQQGMRVQVFNAIGEEIDVFVPSQFPVEVGGIYTSGIYYIRVTSGTGDIYLGRLVVK